MQIQLNGEKQTVPPHLKTVDDLIKHFKLNSKILVVEHNRHVLTREMHATTRLSDGDCIEIVHFVGGG
ncbi:sulfur carrier protein ThiS [Thermoactinomyces intermedius]|uniref:Sulfur carrier protein ThiS n=1 Tax=Thermoactinomyces intermedius TaxID=2024 RepID=A0A8I1ABH8_THEIN|nr:sulfur carrier protein ThiS [Thermoactinomyces intermedius]MBA4547656.1 sulfur carrier protein ThiS [Thermoactinomyces intermedius]MBA4836296.1 sulfur carrier protein ThiS [Thermoactinomyces intermedius]MBH8594115.1 sulfur carrier protein ThiS [Thermoactinomyces intermedius]MBH8600951.1 sulfur carrier protein ThiS [Thermoactinomyces sp. CICC 23799]